MQAVAYTYRENVLTSQKSEKNARRGYRFGFNGQEKDNEVYGEGSSYTAEYWQYDPRLGRRWNVDPVVKHWESPYATFLNSPIVVVDIKGDDGIAVIQESYNKKGKRTGGVITIKQNFYYTTQEGEKGAFSVQDATYVENNIKDQYNSVNGQSVKIKGEDGKTRTYKLKIEVNVINAGGTIDNLYDKAESDVSNGNQLGNVLLSNMVLGKMDGSDAYGGSSMYTATILMDKMMADKNANQTDGNTPVHEGIHLLGGEHEDGWIMKGSGPVDRSNLNIDGSTTTSTFATPRKISSYNFEAVIQRALEGKNNQLHIQKGTDIKSE